MQNIRYNPLFGTGDASSDAVNPVFGIARSNPLYGLNARRNEDTTPDSIALAGLGEVWTRVVMASNFRQGEADAEFAKLNEFSQEGILRELNEINEALMNGDLESAELQIAVLGEALPKYFTGEMTFKEEPVDPPRETMGGEEELVGPPLETMQTPFQEYITAQGLEPVFNVMNALLGSEGKFLSEQMFNIAYELKIPELSTLVEGLDAVMKHEAVTFGDIMAGEVDFTEASARLEGMGIAIDAANAIIAKFANATTDQGPFNDLPPHQSGGGWQGVPDFGYGEYQGVAAAGYGTAAPVDFQGELEAAWDVLAGHGISADEYEAMRSSDQEMVLEYARRYEYSKGADTDALENMVNAAFAGLSSEDLEDYFDVPLSTTTADRVEVLKDGFSRAFPFYDIVDQPAYELLQTTITQIERASGIPVTAERLANGLRVFRNVGLTSYRPDTLISILTTICAEFANPDDIVMDVLSSDAFCSPERAANVQLEFGAEAAQKFVDFCELSTMERMAEIELNNFDIAQILDINGSKLDKIAVEHLNEQVAPNPDARQLLEDVQQAVAPEMSSPIARVTVPKTDSKVAKKAGEVDEQGPNKVLAFTVLGATAVALGFLANKLRKM